MLDRLDKNRKYLLSLSRCLKAYERLCCDDGTTEKSYLFFEAGKLRTTKEQRRSPIRQKPPIYDNGNQITNYPKFPQIIAMGAN